MEAVLAKLNTLKRTRSKLDKIDLLKEYLKDTVFKQVVIMASDELMQYGAKKLPANTTRLENITQDDVFSYLKVMSQKPGTTKEEKQTLANMCQNYERRQVVLRILNKDLKCGCGVKTINAASPDLIHSTPYQRCSTIEDIDNLVYPVWSQRKADTMFGYYFVGNEDQPHSTSRKGKRFAFATENFMLDALEGISVQLDGYVIFGELQVYAPVEPLSGNLEELAHPRKVLDRKTGNGILNKALKGTITKEDSDRVFFEVWDCVPEEDFWAEYCDTPYDERYQMLIDNIDENEAIKIMPYTVIFNEAEVHAETERQIADGKEGTITKNLKGVWKYNISKDMIKGKEEKECDMIIVKALYGDANKKYADCIGKFLCESSDGIIIGTLASGVTDEERGIIAWDDNNDPIIREDIAEFMDSYIGDIIAVKFNIVEHDKKTKQEKLYLPRVAELSRPDKDEADDAEYIRKL